MAIPTPKIYGMERKKRHQDQYTKVKVSTLITQTKECGDLLYTLLPTHHTVAQITVFLCRMKTAHNKYFWDKLHSEIQLKWLQIRHSKKHH